MALIASLIQCTLVDRGDKSPPVSCAHGSVAVEVGIGMSVLTLALVVLALFFELSRLHSQSGQQDDGEHSHAENDRGDPGNFDVGNSS